MIFQAHRGVSTENPENTMPAFKAAVEQGYRIIELDVAATKDERFVLLHDKSLNRTARYANGGLLGTEIDIENITYADALQYDFGVWFSKKFKNTRIPLLEDVLELGLKNGIEIKIDNKFQNFTGRQRELFFGGLKPYEKTASLTCSDVGIIREIKDIFPQMNFHYDGPVNKEITEDLSRILPESRLTVWLNYNNIQAIDDEGLIKKIKSIARLGVWILSDYNRLETAETLGADIIETAGELKPELRKGIIADMHTHSENSHDSLCKIEDMYCSQDKKGTSFFAVTDHFDTCSFNDYDVFSPIERSNISVHELNETQGGKCTALSGIEISEGFWYPEIYEKIMNLVDYDVVIGSVHIVRYEKMDAAYSAIDFKMAGRQETENFLDAYFDDILTMLDFSDFDILAHLTCPLRYIRGKYKMRIDMSRYMHKIEKILRLIIKKGIALEVNTSSFGLLNDFMPDTAILKKYYSLGGYLITLGSDAHISENASVNFKEALRTIKSIGFKSIYCYIKRRPYQLSI